MRVISSAVDLESIQTFRDGDAVPEMIVIPRGSFWMGADETDDKFASVLEQPRHRVEIGYGLAVGKYLVTAGQWGEFCKSSTTENDWREPALPVLNVNWDDAIAYAGWLSKITGRAYRLLSESEWEYCCRAGTDSVFQTGSRISVEQANYLYTDFRANPGLGRPVRVGSYPANGFGLFDMHGNACELVADSWHDSYIGAPLDGSAWMDAASRWRVVRGGGWDAIPRILRCAFRDWIGRDQRMDNVGFRVALMLGG